MPIAKPCPKSCKFDWVEFHQKLDMAIAHLIDEQDSLPSKTTLMEFMEYSNAKRLLQERGQFAPEDAQGEPV